MEYCQKHDTYYDSSSQCPVCLKEAKEFADALAKDAAEDAKYFEQERKLDEQKKQNMGEGSCYFDDEVRDADGHTL